jgi:hypothetical protein
LLSISSSRGHISADSYHTNILLDISLRAKLYWWCKILFLRNWSNCNVGLIQSYLKSKQNQKPKRWTLYLPKKINIPFCQQNLPRTLTELPGKDQKATKEPCPSTPHQYTEQW